MYMFDENWVSKENRTLQALHKIVIGESENVQIAATFFLLDPLARNVLRVNAQWPRATAVQDCRHGGPRSAVTRNGRGPRSAVTRKVRGPRSDVV